MCKYSVVGLKEEQQKIKEMIKQFVVSLELVHGPHSPCFCFCKVLPDVNTLIHCALHIATYAHSSTEF